MLGVGVPLLLAAVQYAALRRPLLVAFLFLVAAGAFEDSLSQLPPMTSVSFFMLAAALTRWSRSPWLSMAIAYPVYQLWLYAWLPQSGGGVFMRMLMALPIGVVTSALVGLLLGLLERKAAIDEEG